MANQGIEIENAVTDKKVVNNFAELNTTEFICVKIRGEAFL